eukprot:s657_g20.t2
MGCGASRSYKEPRKIETKWFHDFAAKLPSLEGKVVLVTGCTSGTGFVAARAMAKKGAHVVMLNRKSGRAEEAEKKLLEEVAGSKGEDFRPPVPRAIPVPRFAMEEMHRVGRCTPCRFFAFKEDGCHKGNTCEFCHLCSGPDALKRSKKAHVARKKQEDAMQRKLRQSAVGVAHSILSWQRKVEEGRKDGRKEGVTSVECDLQSLESVRGCAEKLKAMFGDTGIDVLCNNAGVMALADEATKDGYDVQMQTNHLSHFLLTKELFPLLEKGAQLRGEARIVNHSSGARAQPNKVLDAKYLGKNGGNLGGNGSSMIFAGARWQRYHQTKLANVVFTLALASRLTAANSKVKALVCAPGLAATNLQVTTNQNDGMSETWVMRYAQSAEDGTMPLLQCCAGEGVATGDFYEPTKKAMGMRCTGPPAKFELEKICTKEESQKILWDESEKACGVFTIG